MRQICHHDVKLLIAERLPQRALQESRAIEQVHLPQQVRGGAYRIRIDIDSPEALDPEHPQRSEESAAANSHVQAVCPAERCPPQAHGMHQHASIVARAESIRLG
jgi:hypothetical protein